MQITLNISAEIGQALLKQPNSELFFQFKGLNVCF